MLWAALKFIIELISSNHLKWRAQPILSDLFLPQASYPTHPFLRLSFSRFHIFNISAFQIPKCFNFFGRVLNICMRSDFEGLLGGSAPAGGIGGVVPPTTCASSRTFHSVVETHALHLPSFTPILPSNPFAAAAHDHYFGLHSISLPIMYF